jgi:DNA-binding SARP family transcriptional activator
VVRAEPLRESAHRALVMVHLHEGNYGEALRQYQRCRALLHDELGIDPSPRLHDLVFGTARRDTLATPLSRRLCHPSDRADRRTS